MMTLISSIALLLLALCSVPLFVVILAAAMLGFYRSGVDLQVVALEFYKLAEMPVLSAIPLFTFAGYLLGESRAPYRLVRITDALLGWLPGGLAIVALSVCALFTAFTGASGITIIALGAVLWPALQRAGYQDRFNLGLIATSGSLGILFAPSLPLILYAVVAQQLVLQQPVNINDLFLAGILPGLLMILALSVYSLFQARRHQPSTERTHGPNILVALREVAWEIPLPFLILGGIYGGVFAISDAAAVTAFYVLIVTVFIRREVAFSSLPKIVIESMMLVGAITIILGVSLASTNYVVDAEIPMQVFEFIREHIDSKASFLILLTVFLLILGMLLDIFSAIVIMVPIILPIAIGYEIHPIHFGILFLANMQLGYLTPPVGMNLFIASLRFQRPLLEVYRATIPFFVILLIVVLLVTYWPALSLVLL